MAQVRALDSALLKAQDPDQHAGLAIGAVAIVDGGAPDYRRLERLLAERIPSMPRCTQVLRPHPTRHEWVDCPGFDLARHVRRVAVPRPGDEAELAGAIAHALEQPLRPDRPPWECWVIEGLKGNRWAILMKTHHRLLDGNSPAYLLTRLCDDADSTAFTNVLAAERVPSDAGPRPGWPDALWRASWAATGAVLGAVWPGLRTPDRAAVLRRYATVRVPIADVDRVCRRFGATVNDVALAATTEGFRTVLLGRGEEPRADSLRTLVPTPVRSPYLPVEHDDPVRRLRAVQARWVAGEAGPRSGGIVDSALDSLPNMVRHGVIQLLSLLPRRPIVSLATNAPGPRHPLRLMGQTMERVLPIPPTAVALSTGVAVLSYGDELVFGITAEPGAAFGARELAAGIELGMARLVALSQDSVLLFGDRRRKRSPRAAPRRAPGPRPPFPGQARH